MSINMSFVNQNMASFWFWDAWVNKPAFHNFHMRCSQKPTNFVAKLERKCDPALKRFIVVLLCRPLFWWSPPYACECLWIQTQRNVESYLVELREPNSLFTLSYTEVRSIFVFTLFSSCTTTTINQSNIDNAFSADCHINTSSLTFLLYVSMSCNEIIEKWADKNGNMYLKTLRTTSRYKWCTIIVIIVYIYILVKDEEG